MPQPLKLFIVFQNSFFMCFFLLSIFPIRLGLKRKSEYYQQIYTFFAQAIFTLQEEKVEEEVELELLTQYCTYTYIFQSKPMIESLTQCRQFKEFSQSWSRLWWYTRKSKISSSLFLACIFENDFYLVKFSEEKEQK